MTYMIHHDANFNLVCTYSIMDEEAANLTPTVELIMKHPTILAEELWHLDVYEEILKLLSEDQLAELQLKGYI